MKSIAFTYLSCWLLLGASSLFAASRDPATKDDLKAVLQAIEKRFEQIDKRLEFHQNLLLVLIVGMIGLPFLIHDLAGRRAAADRQAFDETRRVVIALRELSTKDKKVAEALRIAGLL